MSMNPIPPQAYTKETMLKAFNWLHEQPPSIREMAATPDILVSLYLKARRDGDEALDRPSIQNFKAELKNLAGLMGEFGGPKVPPAQPPPPVKTQAPNPAPPAAPAPAPTTYLPQTAPQWSSQGFEIDAKSLEMLKEIKEDFNLSHESEALRMLIKIGFGKAKTLLKDR